MHLGRTSVAVDWVGQLTRGPRRRLTIACYRLSQWREGGDCRFLSCGGVRHLPLPRLPVSRETLLVEAGAANFALRCVVAEFVVVEAQAWVGFWRWGCVASCWSRAPSLRPAAAAALIVVTISLVLESAVNGVDFFAVVGKRGCEVGIVGRVD